MQVGSAAVFSRGLPMRRLLVGVAVFLSAWLAGCAQMATYNASYITPPATPAADKLAGKVLVYTTEADDKTPWVGAPTSFTGSGTTLTIPLSVIAREIAAVVFGDAFRDGAVKANTLADAAAYRAVVQPRVVSYSYEYNQLKNVGFAITPTALATLEVTLYDPTGKQAGQWRYESGTVEAPAYFISGSPGEEIGKVTHKALFDLMTRAVTDLRLALRTKGDTPLSL